MTDAEFLSWLKDESAIRCVLMEVTVRVGGVETTRYLSNKGYVTKGTDIPAHTSYSPVIVGGVKFTESLSLDGATSLSFGDIEITNAAGDKDTWLNDVWTNRSCKMFIGDVSWPRADFRKIFDGMVVNISTRRRDRLNIKLSDKLQRLNTVVSEVKLGGTTSNKDKLIPLCFGECHNVTPLLIDAVNQEYQVHDGAIESIIEVRDNGVPVQFTPFLSTGKFRLVSQPVGAITCSVQGAYSRNLTTYSEQINNAAWNKNNVVVTTDAVESPDVIVNAEKVAENTANTSHSTSVNSTTVNGLIYTLSIHFKAAELSIVQLVGGSGTFGLGIWANFDLTTGTVLRTGSTTLAAGIVPLANGWFRCYVTGLAVASTTGAGVVIGLTNNLNTATRLPTYVGASKGVYAWGAQLEQSPVMTTYRATVASNVNLYFNTIADIVKLLSYKYGTVDSRLTYSDYDLVSLELFNNTNAQPVGLYLSDRTNVLEACNRLAQSIGAKVAMNPNGQLYLLQLDLNRSDLGTTVTASDMVARSLSITEMPSVIASVKIGYCKNWTVQPSLPTGLPPEHAKLYAEEYLTLTRSDSGVASTYKLFSDPVMVETLLLTEFDAEEEALRRLDTFVIQRAVYSYQGFPSLMLEALGASQTIKHERYGLSNGKTGQIISKATDWTNLHVDIGVLI